MEQKEMQSVWGEMLDKLLDTTTESEHQRWLLPMTPTSLTETTLTLGTKNEFSRNYIKDHYIPFLIDAAKAVTGKKIEIFIETLHDEPEEKETLSPKAEPAEIPVSSQPPLFPSEAAASPSYSSISHFTPVAPGDNSSLKEKYTFENFVMGPSNRFAHAAALAVVKSPGKVYNPLFLYGGVGLGKTHLMHAIGNEILKTNPNMRVLYISSERFLNDFIASIREGKPREFQNKYRNIDVLLVDDIQFLYTKERTQEEFFHTFNSLYDADKAIILSADRHPRDIKSLEDRLRSRFEWGLITDIQAPDLETRIAILQKKALSDNLEIPDDVLYFIASRIDSNIRELEGALTRVKAQSSLDHQSITVDLASRAMSGSYPTERKQEITLELIQDVTASYFNISTEDLLSKKRSQDVAFPRQVAMYLCRTLTDTSTTKIGDVFGGKDHTTVLHACEKIAKKKDGDSHFNQKLGELVDRIRHI